MRFFTLLAFVGEYIKYNLLMQLCLNIPSCVGFAAASLESSGSGGSSGPSGRSMWSPGIEYTYEYQGRLLTGIPELASHHFSGVGIKCKLSLTVTRSGRIVLQIRGAEYARVNDVRLRLRFMNGNLD